MRAPRLDFVSVLGQADCLAALQAGVDETERQTLALHTNDSHIQIVSVWGADVRGRPSALWLFRFEGELTATNTGTLIYGRIRRNLALEAGLALTWLSLTAISGLCLLLVDPVVAVLVSPLMVLLSGFYVVYQLLLHHQTRELMGWIEAWLLLPKGRAGDPLPP